MNLKYADKVFNTMEVNGKSPLIIIDDAQMILEKDKGLIGPLINLMTNGCTDLILIFNSELDVLEFNLGIVHQLLYSAGRI